MSFLDEFDPLKGGKKAPAAVQATVPQTESLPNVFDEESLRFAQLTGVDRATAAVHLRAAKLRGASFNETVDRFYQNNGMHVRDNIQAVDEAQIAAAAQKREVVAADNALAVALAEEDRERAGSSARVEDVVLQLEEMGFSKKLAVSAVAATSGKLEDATEWCIRNKSAAPKISTGPPRPQGMQDMRMSAMRVMKVGSLYKMASSKSVLGARWQSRAFEIRNGVLSYSSGSGGPPSKTINLWQCYALRSYKKVGGKTHCFVVYASEEAATTQSSHSKIYLAAEDERTVNEWLIALFAAGGRPRGCVVKISHDGTLRCACNFAAPALDVDPQGCITQVGQDAKAAGLRIGDHIVKVGDEPTLAPNTAKALVARARRPFEMTVVRAPKPSEPLNSTSITQASNISTNNTQRPHTPAAPVLDLLCLDEVPDVDEQKTVPAADPQQNTVINKALQDVRQAQQSVEYSEHLVKVGNYAQARTEARRAVDILLEFQPVYSANAQVRDAVAHTFPSLGLAEVYDRAVNVAQTADPLPTPPQQQQAATITNPHQPNHNRPENNHILHGTTPNLMPTAPRPVLPARPQNTDSPVTTRSSTGAYSSPGNSVHSPSAAPRYASHQQPPPQIPPRQSSLESTDYYARQSTESSYTQQPSMPQAPPAMPPRPTQPSYKAVYAFDATEAWQLSVTQEEALEVVEILDDGWADVVNAQQQRGLVPSSYVAPL